jgi:hypothetical protein
VDGESERARAGAKAASMWPGTCEITKLTCTYDGKTLSASVDFNAHMFDGVERPMIDFSGVMTLSASGGRSTVTVDLREVKINTTLRFAEALPESKEDDFSQEAPPPLR